MSAVDPKKRDRIESFLLGGMATREIFENLERARAIDSEWAWMFDAVDPLTADQQIVRQLHENAPTEYLKGVIGGVLMMRESIALITGRGF